MPHDVNGQLLEPGDEIVLRAVVTEIIAGEDYCNVAIKSVHPRKPDGTFESNWLNAACLELVKKGDPAVAEDHKDQAADAIVDAATAAAPAADAEAPSA